MKYFIVTLASVLMTAVLVGCGANFVAADKSLGIPDGKKPVVGLIVAGFTVNSEGNPLGPILGAKYAEDVTQNLKDRGIDAKVINFSVILTHQQLAAAIKKYDSLPQAKKWISERFEYGDLKKDFGALGIDMLVILSGSAGNASIPTWVQLTTFAAFGSIGLNTPITDNIVTSVSREGKPIYNELTTFSRMGRRDFGNDSHRKAMASVIANGIKDNSF